MHPHPDDPYLRLSELRHRLANCFQLISSLIRLRLNRVADPEGRKHLGWLLDVVTALGLLQERLSSPSAGTFDQYLAEVAAFWGRAGSARGIEVVALLDPVALPAGDASTLAIIVHELLNNAMHHAFPGTRKGRIVLALRPLGPERAELAVIDNGVGLDRSVEPTGYGLELVRSLVRQLGGDIRIDGVEGTKVRVSFPVITVSPPASERH